MPGARRRSGWRTPIGALVVLCLAGCTTSEPTATEGPDPSALDVQPGSVDVLFRFEDMMEGATLITSNEGTLQGDAEFMAVNGGELGLEPGPDGQAVRFPAFDDSSDPGRAVLVYRGAEGLDPGREDFRFGADFTLDEVTEGGEDDGNNVVQRGLSADPVQFKIQADGGVASCRLAGDQGSVTVKSRVPLDPHVWYRVQCQREGGEVRLDVRTVDGREVDVVQQRANVGSLEFDSSVALAMGGKLTPDGEVVRGKADQLNGALDNVFVDVG